jgi:hypothetical protein
MLQANKYHTNIIEQSQRPDYIQIPYEGASQTSELCLMILGHLQKRQAIPKSAKHCRTD